MCLSHLGRPDEADGIKPRATVGGEGAGRLAVALRVLPRAEPVAVGGDEALRDEAPSKEFNSGI